MIKIRLYKPLPGNKPISPNNINPHLYALVYEGPMEDCGKTNILNILYQAWKMEVNLTNTLSFEEYDVVEVIEDSYNNKGDFYFNNTGEMKKISFNKEKALSFLPDISKRICDRIFFELRQYEEWVQTKDVKTIYEQAYKIVFMRELATYFTNLVGNKKICDTLLKKIYNYDFILENLYAEWLSSSMDIQEPIEDFLEDFTETLWRDVSVVERK